MSYSDSARRFASEELERRRQRAELMTERRRGEAFEMLPRLREIEDEIRDLGISAMRATASGEQNVLESAGSRISELKDRRHALLRGAGLPEDSLDDYHFCRECRDSGRLPDGGDCSCFCKLLSEYAVKELNSVSPLKLCSFDSFSLEWYSKDKDPEYGISPYKAMENNLKACREFARDFPSCASGLLMIGDAGLGKTHLALSIADEVLKKGHEVIYCSAPSVFKTIEKEQFDGRDTSTADNLKSCELLVLDDLGAEFINSFLVSAIYDIVNSRLVSGLKTIYTTNLTDVDKIAIRYSEKVSSRLIGSCRVLPFFGDDIRIAKNRIGVVK